MYWSAHAWRTTPKANNVNKSFRDTLGAIDVFIQNINNVWSNWPFVRVWIRCVAFHSSPTRTTRRLTWSGKRRSMISTKSCQPTPRSARWINSDQTSSLLVLLLSTRSVHVTTWIDRVSLVCNLKLVLVAPEVACHNAPFKKWNIWNMFMTILIQQMTINEWNRLCTKF